MASSPLLTQSLKVPDPTLTVPPPLRAGGSQGIAGVSAALHLGSHLLGLRQLELHDTPTVRQPWPGTPDSESVRSHRR